MASCSAPKKSQLSAPGPRLFRGSFLALRPQTATGTEGLWWDLLENDQGPRATGELTGHGGVRDDRLLPAGSERPPTADAAVDGKPPRGSRCAQPFTGDLAGMASGESPGCSFAGSPEQNLVKDKRSCRWYSLRSYQDMRHGQGRCTTNYRLPN
jgi:hypothetical protein